MVGERWIHKRSNKCVLIVDEKIFIKTAVEDKWVEGILYQAIEGGFKHACPKQNFLEMFNKENKDE